MIKKILIYTLLTIALFGCTKTVLPGNSITLSTLIHLNFKSFDNNPKPILNEIEMFVFNNGILSDMSTQKIGNDNTISLELNNVIRPKIFFIADPNNQVDYSNIKEGKTSESDFLVICTKELNFENGDYITPFYTGMKDLSGIIEPRTNIDIKQGVARFDVNIEPNKGISIESMKITNVSVKSYIHSKPVSGDDNFKMMDFDKVFTPELNANRQNICYLFEQNSINSQVELKLSGIDKTLTVDLPDRINRNNIYEINVTIEGNIAKVHIAVKEWTDGEDTEIEPDFEFSKIDLERSELPAYVHISETLDTLFIPSCNTTFQFAISATTEIDVELEELEGFTVTSILNPDAYINTLFEISAKPRGIADTVSLNIKNRNHAEYYGDKIVMVLEASTIKYGGEIANYLDKSNIDFNNYVDGDIGTVTVLEGTTVSIESDIQWLKSELVEGEYIIKAGYRPNDPDADGRDQNATIIVTHGTGENSMEERYEITRKNFGLPVELMKEMYWCKFNLQGNAISFTDQVQINDPISQEADLYTYLKTCTNMQFMAIVGDAYKGQNHTGLKLKADAATTTGFSFENYATTTPNGNITNSDPKKQCPSGYQIPNYSDISNLLGTKAVHFPAVSNNEATKTLGERVFYKYERTDIEFDGAMIDKMIVNKSESDGVPNFVLIGLGYQWSATGMRFDQSILANIPILTYNRSWEYGASIFDSVKNEYNTRTIRCIKTPGAFIY